MLFRSLARGIGGARPLLQRGAGACLDRAANPFLLVLGHHRPMPREAGVHVARAGVVAAARGPRAHPPKPEHVVEAAPLRVLPAPVSGMRLALLRCLAFGKRDLGLEHRVS
jgi:hypothetical protein